MSTFAVPVEDSSRVADARRAAVELAGTLGFDTSDSGRAALVATEAATNMIRHAGSGQLIASVVRRGGRAGVQVLALDRGPGMADVDQCVRDGYSTAGSSGTGLGAILRLSSESDIYSAPGQGTALLSRIWPRQTPPLEPIECGGVAVPLRGEEICGDSWAWRAWETGGDIIMADGLGHGPQAAQASLEAVRIFSEYPDLDPAGVIQQMDGALRSTRGAAVAVARVSLTECNVRFAGVGNIAGAVISRERTHQVVSYAGTVGGSMHKVREFVYAWPEEAVFVLHSDGLVSHWSVAGYPGLLRHDPALVAGVLYRDFARGRDDASVVVIRRSGE